MIVRDYIPRRKEMKPTLVLCSKMSIPFRDRKMRTLVFFVTFSDEYLSGVFRKKTLL